MQKNTKKESTFNKSDLKKRSALALFYPYLCVEVFKIETISLSECFFGFSHIEIVCDSYFSNSLKSHTQETRGCGKFVNLQKPIVNHKTSNAVF